ncbi:MAG: metallophosphoesterase [Betaproteobacteria bacterium]|nr:metallophosphoesterase [Betaproteobacteria bacterium]
MGRFALFAVSALFHAYIGLRLFPDLGAWAPANLVLLLWLVISALLMPLGLQMRRAGGSDALAWAGLLCMGLFSSLFVLTVLRDIVFVVYVSLQWLLPSLDWGNWQADSALAVPLIALALSLVGFFNARRTAAVVRVDVPIAGLPAGLHGFSIAQISDIHVGPTIKAPYVEAIVAAVNTLGADMVAITGDLVDGTVAQLRAHVAPLADLSSRHGTFFVTGNHEYYSGAPAWVAELRRLGLNVLMNQHVVLEQGAAALAVAGVTDFGAGHFDPAQASSPQAAIAGAPADAFKLLLAHQPRSAPAAAAAGFNLQLSGHTHGGQFLPWNFFVRLQQPFTAGLDRLHDLWVYTSRGTGYWGPPQRFGAPSEITLLRLVPGV